MKVITVVGTRPEIIRLSRVIDKLDRSTNHVLVHTGQNYDYELNQIFFDELEIRKPDFFLNAASGTAAATIGNVIIKFDELLEQEKPDALLVLGDTNSSLCVIPAKRRKIPIFHMEAGNRCYDERVPEEINRKIVDHTSDINMPYSSIAREYLLKEGFPGDQIIKTGSPMYEVLDYYKTKIDASEVVSRLDLEKEKYFVISSHREENVDQEKTLRKIANILEKICEAYNFPVIFSTHPRTQKRLEMYNIQLHPLVQILKPLGFLDYIKLQQNAFCVISDSGTITEEASIVNFPAINLRESHERPEGMEEAVVIMTGLDVDTVIDAIPVAANIKRGEAERSIKLVEDYYAPNVSDKVLKIIMSYTGFVKRKVWKIYE
ncbi:non-hydrolyzing UDP-N-acetylglucosamine 2-epimerase [Lacibacter sp.]|uniref:non-hydrolyzing UDP-N-acetylglucosamine 2-epimerase n=1 Tax=Lacibacter sp. TaxID=1915409 RepID=UPI002B4B4764|nr:UDP-N-acetylglucosamine 2-epimerase (non-hydrolyzing) [Lacibacter sp.]HLP36101.1 UDP-N-acetylglucosamine 2-epimerase (non-hydrolyzing) [Lacibacter sp.]